MQIFYRHTVNITQFSVSALSSLSVHYAGRACSILSNGGGFVDPETDPPALVATVSPRTIRSGARAAAAHLVNPSECKVFPL